MLENEFDIPEVLEVPELEEPSPIEMDWSISIVMFIGYYVGRFYERAKNLLSKIKKIFYNISPQGLLFFTSPIMRKHG